MMTTPKYAHVCYCKECGEKIAIMKHEPSGEMYCRCLECTVIFPTVQEAVDYFLSDDGYCQRKLSLPGEDIIRLFSYAGNDRFATREEIAARGWADIPKNKVGTCRECLMYHGMQTGFVRIKKDKKTGKLFCGCDRCGSVWRNIEDALTLIPLDRMEQYGSRIVRPDAEGIDEWEEATREEIVSFGWDEYDEIDYIESMPYVLYPNPKEQIQCNLTQRDVIKRCPYCFNEGRIVPAKHLFGEGIYFPCDECMAIYKSLTDVIEERPMKYEDARTLWESHGLGKFNAFIGQRLEDVMEELQQEFIDMCMRLSKYAGKNTKKYNAAMDEQIRFLNALAEKDKNLLRDLLLVLFDHENDYVRLYASSSCLVRKIEEEASIALLRELKENSPEQWVRLTALFYVFRVDNKGEKK